MKIDSELIAYLENLSRLELSEAEREQAKTDLAGVIEYMDVLGGLDTQGLPALSHPFENVNRLREDKAEPSFERARILSNAAVKTGEYFKTPKTVE